MNKRIFKAGVLAVLLAIPAFVFLFLHTFGENRYDLPYLFPKLDEAGQVVKNGADTVFHQIPDFTLTAQNGQPYSRTQLEGKITVVNFFFTRCGTICPRLSEAMHRVQENFRKDEIVQLLSVSVDPKHDTPQILQAYANRYQADSLKWHLVTGEKGYVYDLILKGFKLPVADASAYDPTISNVDEQFIHSEKIVLVDGRGFIRGIYDGTNKQEIERLIGEIKVLLDITQKSK